MLATAMATAAVLVGETLDWLDAVILGLVEGLT